MPLHQWPQFLLVKLLRNDALFFSPFAKQWITKDIPRYRSQLKRAKIALTLSITTNWPYNPQRSQILPPTDHTNTTGHMPPSLVTGITTYWPYHPSGHRYYHLLTIPHQWSQVLPPTDHTTPMVTGITTYWPYHPNGHRYYHLLTTPPQWSQVLPPNDHTTQTNLCSVHIYM